MASSTLDDAGRLFTEHAWNRCRALLVDEDRAAGLDGPGLELLASVTFLCGDDIASEDAWTRAYRWYTDHGDDVPAARSAVWLANGLFYRGEIARGSGWLSRAQELVAPLAPDRVEHGYVMMPTAQRQVRGGDAAPALAAATEALALAHRHHDPDLATLAGLVAGQARFLMGDAEAGFRYLDELMVAVTAGEVSPAVTGIAYCAVVEICQGVFDIERASEWTAALIRFCQDQPELAPFRGLCLVHRSQITQFGGSWAEAVTWAQQACDRLDGRPEAGQAYYQLGELRRLRGEVHQAEDCYRLANRWGRLPEPGLILLRMAQGRTEDAAASARRLLVEVPTGPGRPELLAAAVGVLLAVGDVERARAAADELHRIAERFGVPMLTALWAEADGAVRQASGDDAGALNALRTALGIWTDLGSPYRAALVRVQVAGSLRALGDPDAATLQLDEAGRVFDQVGAAPDVRRTAALAAGGTAGAAPLTEREVEVLRLVATGRSNRDVAASLVLSEKTVARHLSNIYAKLDLTSRSAATAYAYEHHLV